VAQRRLVLTVPLAVLAVAACGCSFFPSASPSGGRASTRAVSPTTAAAPLTASTAPTTTTTTAPSGVVSTVPVPADPAPGWSQALTTLPPGGGFSSVSCISDTFCIAAGGGTGGQGGSATAGSGATVSWDGASWSEPSVYLPAPTTGPVTAPVLPAISCTSGPTCVIVDGSDHVSTGDGTNWASASPLSPGPPLPPDPAEPSRGQAAWRDASVSCPSPKFCAVVDNTGHAYTMRNGDWLATQSLGRPAADGATTSLYQPGTVGVSCPTSSSCVAVVGTSVLDWNGTTWSIESSPWTPALAAGSTAAAISCPTTTLCAIVSGTGLSYRNGGRTWSPLETIDPHGGLDAISCPTTSFCMAADSGGSMVTWNGTAWSSPVRVIPQASQYPGIATSLSCPTVHYCLVMNADGDFATYSSS
jgi:hypothetical protein